MFKVISSKFGKKVYFEVNKEIKWPLIDKVNKRLEPSLSTDLYIFNKIIKIGNWCNLEFIM